MGNADGGLLAFPLFSPDALIEICNVYLRTCVPVYGVRCTSTRKWNLSCQATTGIYHENIEECDMKDKDVRCAQSSFHPGVS